MERRSRTDGVSMTISNQAKEGAKITVFLGEWRASAIKKKIIWVISISEFFHLALLQYDANTFSQKYLSIVLRIPIDRLPVLLPSLEDSHSALFPIYHLSRPNNGLDARLRVREKLIVVFVCVERLRFE